MSIELFKKTNYRGKSLRRINSDSSDLRDTILGNNPSSIKITDDNKAILLCKKKKWNGKVFYLRGKKNISDLGDENDGGKKGFGNSITSIRVTPFTVKLNITIVTGDDGTLPGNWSSRTKVIQDIKTIISMANDFYDNEKALLKVELSDLTFRADEKRFRMSKKEWKSIPTKWKRSHLIDIVFPDTIEGAVGIGKLPWTGKFCLVSARRFTVDEMARTFVHELGHYWGLTHQIAAANIMTQSSRGKHITKSKLQDNQVEFIQQKLASNISRQGDRFE